MAVNTTAEGRAASLFRYFAAFVSSEFGLARELITRELKLADLGFDSIAKLRLLRELQTDLGISITGRQLLQTNTLDDVVKLALRAEKSSIEPVLEANGELETCISGSGPFPLSFVQRGIWLLQSNDPRSIVYNVPICLSLRGKLHLDALRAAVRAIVTSHPMLSLRIVEAEGVPLQKTVAAEVSLAHSDAHHRTVAEILQHLQHQVTKPFDLKRESPIRIVAVSNSPDLHFILIVVHHIACDGAALPKIVATLQDSYNALAAGKAFDNRRNSASYFDFVRWEQSFVERESAKQHGEYWKTTLRGELPILEFPRGVLRSVCLDTTGFIVRKSVLGITWKHARSLCAALNVSPAILFLSIYKILLHRYTNQEDLVVGVPTRGRPDARFEDVVGCFVNIVALRSRILGSLSIAEFANAVSNNLADALDHSVYPFQLVVKNLNLKRDANVPPLFQTSYEYTSRHDRLALQGEWEEIDGFDQAAELPLVLGVTEKEDAFELAFKCAAGGFDRNAIARMTEHFIHLLNQAIATPTACIGDLELVTEAEAHSLLVEWNRTQIDYDKTLGVHDLVTRQCAITPDATAVTFQDTKLTYRDLEQQSQGLAYYLHCQGIGPGDKVGICLRRSTDLLAAMLGILKVGAAYVPLDPMLPIDRLRYMLRDSAAKAVVVHSNMTQPIEFGLTDSVVVVDLDLQQLAALPRHTEHASEWVTARLGGESLAYIMYTSGSTGQPKGVMIPHRALTNFLLAMRDAFNLDVSDRVLAATNYSFDISGLEFYLPLISGSECSIVPTETLRDEQELLEVLNRIRPTLMQATPTTWLMLTQAGWKNDAKMRILCGGEALPKKLWTLLRGLGCEAWNLYGPTETTVWSTLHKIGNESHVTIGRPIANTQLHILDRYGKLTPIGVAGELCIAGDGLARGYINKSQLTAHQFMDNPFVTGKKLYRTGDLAFWNENGTVECLGRIDSQIKLRGYRIEIEEVEGCLVAHTSIDQCAVVLAEAMGAPQLVAFCVTDDSRPDGFDLRTPQTVRDIRDFLKCKLPEYMVPSRFIGVSKLPLTNNGKIDRIYLQSLASGVGGNSIAEGTGSSANAATMLQVWREVLKVDNVALNDGFFDIGGDSLLASVLANRIRNRFGCKFSVTDLFRHGTVSEALSRVAELKSECNDTASGNQSVVADTFATSCVDRVAGSASSDLEGAIAVVGMSCRFPGADNYREFWRNLIEGKESIEQLTEPAHTATQAELTRVVHKRAALRNKDCFDAQFFGLSPHDAELMDPQHRLLLQEAWRAVEDAGYDCSEIPNTSVFISTSNNVFHGIAAENPGNVNVSSGADAYLSWLMAQAGTIPTMISHRLGFQGASVHVHANCSSSLVGLHAAAQSLTTGESDYALVGAAAIHLAGDAGYVAQEGLSFSKTGQVRSFDASADGMVPGEGVAVFLLKRAKDAIADGDHIHALLRSVALNNDGNSKAGFYTPSVAGQIRVIEAALSKARVPVDSIGYVEAHGSGTLLGDPVEFAALKAVYEQATKRRRFCGIGAVKTNIGHADAAAGLAGCIKTILSLASGTIPASLHFHAPNPAFEMDGSPFFVVDKNTHWPSEAAPRRAAVSAFGIGGTNAHAIFEQFVTNREYTYENTSDGPFLIPLSAKTHEQLIVYATQLLEFLTSFSSSADIPRICDIAYTLQVGRQAMSCRTAFVVNDISDLLAALRGFITGKNSTVRSEAGRGAGLHLLSKQESGILVRGWLANHHYQKIADAWIAGLPLDWNCLYVSAIPKRVCLPTYPFTLERFPLPMGGRANLANEKIFGNSTANAMSPRSARDPRAAATQSVLGATAPAELTDVPEPIAIIGISGHYPGADTLAEYWELLKRGGHSTREIPQDRWPLQGFYEENVERAIEQGKSYSKVGAFLERFAEFDPLFFGIAPREAMNMDPQERLFLQACWEVMEDAGYTRAALAARHGGRVGVYAGVTKTGYELYHAELWRRGEYLNLSTSFGSIANRVSYLFDFRGPSMPIDTMCSASLTAIHEACEHLRRGECELAIAGGVNLYLHPASYIDLSALRMLSSSGQCRAFGAGADGFVPGEGVGAVLLKPLRQAVLDRDHIHAVIRGSSVNHGGRTNGFTVPNPRAQREVIARAHAQAKINPRHISYIEAHGTGTELGDPVEIAGLKQAFEIATDDRQFCAIGSVKPNIGHLEAAAGIAGLTKVVLQMKHRQIVSTINSERTNPNIDFAQTPFRLQREVETWNRPVSETNGTRNEYSRMAGINSFGAGGSNAHLIVEEYTSNESRDLNGSPATMPAPLRALIVVSARDANRLRVQVEQLQKALSEDLSSLSIVDVAYTLQIGREAMESRMAFTAVTLEEMRNKLQAYLELGADSTAGIVVGEVRKNKKTIAEFSGDKDVASLIDRWVKLGNDERVLDLWTKGLAVDWSPLYDTTGPFGALKPKRVSLPTYPFARERYWLFGSTPVDRPSVEPVQSTSSTSEGEREVFTKRLPDEQKSTATENSNLPPAMFVEEWIEVGESNDRSEALDAIAVGDVVVILVSDPQLQFELAAAANRTHPNVKYVFVERSVSTVRTAESVRLSKRLADQGKYVSYQVDESVASYIEAMRDILATEGRIAAVVCGWMLESRAQSWRVSQRDYSRLKPVLQAIDSVGCKNIRITIACEYQDEFERCFAEAWIGYERSLPHGMSGVQCAVVISEASAWDSIDNTSLALRAAMEQRWSRIWSELQRSQVESSLYIRDTRHVLRGRAVTTLSNRASKLRRGGTYLITGGLGALGYLCARYLAERYSARLVLVGRTAIDDAERSKINALTALGAEVSYIRADVADELEFKSQLDETRSRFGSIHGVIHAAGVSGRGNILTTEDTQFETVLAAKIGGTLAVDHLLANDKLDFVCYFSSTAAVLGDFGSCDYAIGNRFQIAYARYRDRQRVLGRCSGGTIAICWPFWLQGGMGFETEEAQRLYLESSGQRALESDEGLALLEHCIALSGEEQQRIVLIGDPKRMIAMLRRSSNIYEDELALAPGDDLVLDQPSALSLAQRVHRDLQEQLCLILKLERGQFTAEKTLADYGVDSVSLARFAQRLSAHFKAEVLPSIFFDYPTLEALTNYFVSRLESVVKARYANELANVVAAPARKAETHSKPSSTTSARANARFEPIAVIGMSGRFPDARDVEELWRVLAKSESVVRGVQPQDTAWRFSDVNVAGTASTDTSRSYLGVLPGVAEFDPLFFDISPHEAELMDPRQRLLLQEAFKALENAGYGADQLSKQRIGMFVGAEQGDYAGLVGGAGNIVANHDAILASRLSYFLNLRGPAMMLNTSCSSGLVAVHQACLSLQADECDAAIVAGVNLILSTDGHAELARAGILSNDGSCYAFDRRANGMVPGEAVVVVVLKRLSHALVCGDEVHGVIRGSGINCDGKTNGITAPSGLAQAELLRDVYRRAGISTTDIDYIVTHGTGTQLGDPVEISALHEVFLERPVDEPRCALTSIKPNIGHTFAAAGLVNLVSLLLALRNEAIPASLNCESPTAFVDWRRSPFYINRALKAWPRRPGRSRFGAVSAFGMSGTNAHVVVESGDVYQVESGSGDPDAWRASYHLFVFSAKSEAALSERARDLATMLESMSGVWNDTVLASLCHTLFNHRHHFAHRCALVVRDLEDTLLLLRKLCDGKTDPFLLRGHAREVGKATPAEYVARRAIGRLAIERNQPLRYRQSLLEIAECYCKGVSNAWQMYAETPQRVALPNYPFARQKYWVNAGNESVRKSLNVEQSTPKKASDERIAAVGVAPKLNSLRSRVIRRLIDVLSRVTKIPAAEIDGNERLEHYGIDSLMITRLNDQMEALSASLPKTLFFEYQTLVELAEYLLEEHHDSCARWVDAGVERPVANNSSVLPGVRLRETVEAIDRITVASDSTASDIAIIGVSGRYPRARNLEAYWENIKAGVNCIGDIPAERWRVEKHYEADVEKAIEQGKSYCKVGGFLEGFAEFDALFFGVTPSDAIYRDPQERLFLQVCWEVIEDAGYTRERLAQEFQGRVGVFAGITKTGFDLHSAEARAPGAPLYPLTNFSSVANRVSYFMNLHGPSLSIDTMCSASLTAIHEASEHIRRGECELAIAGGVNLYLHPSSYAGLCSQRMLSPDGVCRSFGAGGNGFVPGEGVGAVLLKPLSTAVRDGDRIYGVIKATSVNHGGKTNGYTVPNPKAQCELISAALCKSGRDARSVGYIEAHGTGTELGDPIEIAALTQAFARHTQSKQFCAIGSVKTNIGHLEAAAGIAGLTKVLLQMQHGQLAPSLHSETPNPHIDFANTPFKVQRELAEWRRERCSGPGKDGELPRLAGVSSFGAGGVNAHVIVEEYISDATQSAPPLNDPPALFVLSAKNEHRLQDLAEQLRSHLDKHIANDRTLIDIAYTLQVGREAMEHRLAFAASTLTDAIRKLHAYATDRRGFELSADCYVGESRQHRDALTIFTSDDDGRAAIEAWMQKGKYAKLLELWVRGLPIDWSRFYGPGSTYCERQPRIVGLPTYCFARDQYWNRSHHDASVAAEGAGYDLEVNGALAKIVDDCIAGRVSTATAVNLTLRLHSMEEP